MTATTLIDKKFYNSTRIFDKKLWYWQSKAMKTLVKWFIQKRTTVIQALYEKDSGILANKFRESISNHLWNVDLRPIIEDKAESLIKQSKKYKWRNILAWDAWDIFKPESNKMEKLTIIRDWSTWDIWNWYVLYGININGITHQISMKDPNIEYIWTEKREEMLKKSANIIVPEETIWVFDRWHDDVWFIDILQELSYHYVVRARKNRIIIDLNTWKEIKIELLEPWKYRAELEIWTSCYLYIFQEKWRKEPIRMYSDIDFETEKECLEIYLRRRKIEEDYRKHKEFWLEKVRLMTFKKIENIMLLIQFIVVLWQSIFNEVTQRVSTIWEAIYIYYKKFCKSKVLTMNPSSILKFISEYIGWLKIYNHTDIPRNSLFWSIQNMKKVGLI